ncbi:MAG: PAC2 family protein [Candidatus Diapherotrites archaeon]|nr:PAC2 family protein [Candidatus Diapherotrites archaeon]
MVTKTIFLKKKKFPKATLLTGLPGVGLVGKITVDYMLKQFKCEKIAEIISDSFPPSVYTKDAIIKLIKDEIYAFKSQGQSFLFLSGPVQPSLDFRTGSAQEHYEFAHEIVATAKKLGVKRIITLAGINIGDKRLAESPKVISAATNEKLLKEFAKVGAVPGKKEGLISGAAGLILGLAESERVEGVCLMGETNARLVYGDHGAAKKLIEILVKKYGFKVELASIEKEVKHIEDAFKQLAKQFEEIEEKPSEDGPTYIR